MSSAACRAVTPRSSASSSSDGQAALVVIGKSRVGEQLDKALTRAEKSEEREIDADGKELAKELDALPKLIRRVGAARPRASPRTMTAERRRRSLPIVAAVTEPAAAASPSATAPGRFEPGIAPARPDPVHRRVSYAVGVCGRGAPRTLRPAADLEVALGDSGLQLGWRPTLRGGRER